MNDLPLGDTPTDLLRGLWLRLESAVADRHAPFHTAAFCTIGLDGAPDARSVILREVIPDERTLRFHTDVRSAKVAQVRADARVTLLLWDPEMKLQLRINGDAKVHVDDAITRGMAKASHPGALDVFRSVLPPSQIVDSPAAATMSAQPLLEHLSVIGVAAGALEWLWLRKEGHRRGRFALDGAAQHEWLVP